MSKNIVLHCPLNLFFFSSDSWTPFRDTFVAAPISTKVSCSRWLFLSISHFFLILSIIAVVNFFCLKIRRISLSLEHYQVWLKYSCNKCKKLLLWRNLGIRVVCFETLIWFATWLCRFTKTYPILHNLFKRITFFEGSLSNWLVFDPSSCTKPMGWNQLWCFEKWNILHQKS